MFPASSLTTRNATGGCFGRNERCGHSAAGSLGRVVGVDISPALLERARQAELEHPRGIAYVQADVATWSAGETSFDAAICNYGLSDIDDLDGTLKTIAEALRPNGIFVWSILHP